MGAFSNYLEAALINNTVRNTAFTPPANVYVALFTADPGKAGAGPEVSGGSYARVMVPTSTGFSSPAIVGNATATHNVADVLFAAASSSWGTISHYGIFDASTSGNLLYYGPLTVAKPVGTGDTFRFPAASLTITLD